MSSRQSFLFPDSLLSAAHCNKWAAFNLIMGADVGTFQKHVLSHERENEKTFPEAISHFFFPPSQLPGDWTGLLRLKNSQCQTALDRKHEYARNNTRDGFHFLSSFGFGCFWAELVSQDWNQSEVWLLKWLSPLKIHYKANVFVVTQANPQRQA